MKNIKKYGIAVMAVISMLLPSAQPFVLTAQAAETSPRIIETNKDPLTGYYVVYEHKGNTYRSDEMGSAYNRRMWSLLSDEDRNTVTKTLYFREDRLTQFGQEGNDKIMAWHEQTNEWSLAKDQWQSKIMNKNYPELHDFYNDKELTDHYPSIFDSSGTGGVPIRGGDQSLTEAYEKKKTEIVQTWTDGQTAYRQISNFKAKQIAYAVNIGSKEIIKMLSDGFFMPNISRGVGVMSDSLANSFGFAADQAMGMLAQEELTPTEQIDAVASVLQKFAEVAGAKKSELAAQVDQLNSIIAQMRAAVDADLVAGSLKEVERNEQQIARLEEMLLILDLDIEDSGIIKPALPAVWPEYSGDPTDDVELKYQEFLSNVENAKGNISATMANLKIKYLELQVEHDNLLGKLEDKEKAGLAEAYLETWPDEAHLISSKIAMKYNPEEHQLGSTTLIFDPLLEITDLSDYYNGGPLDGGSSTPYYQEIPRFYEEASTAYGNRKTDLTSFNTAAMELIGYRDVFLAELDLITGKLLDIREKAWEMEQFYEDRVVQNNGWKDRYVPTPTREFFAPLYPAGEEEEVGFLPFEQEQDLPRYYNLQGKYERKFESYHEAVLSVEDEILRYEEYITATVPGNKALYTALVNDYEAAMSTLGARYQEYKTNYENALTQMVGAINQLNTLYSDPYFIQGTTGESSYYYDGGLRYAAHAHGAVDMEKIQQELNEGWQDEEAKRVRILNRLKSLRAQEAGIMRAYNAAKTHTDYYEALLINLTNSLNIGYEDSIRRANLETLLSVNLKTVGEIKAELLTPAQINRLILPLLGSNLNDAYDMLQGQTNSYWQIADMVEELNSNGETWRNVSDIYYETQVKNLFQSANTIYSEQKLAAISTAQTGITEAYGVLIQALEDTGVEYTEPPEDPNQGLTDDNPIGVLQISEGTATSARLSAKVYLPLLSQLTEQGFYYTDSESVARDLYLYLNDPTVQKVVATNLDSTTAEFTAIADNLEEGKTYYVFAYGNFTSGRNYLAMDSKTFTASGESFSAMSLVQIGINPSDGGNTGIFVGIKDIKDAEGNVVLDAQLADYQIALDYDPSQIKVFNVADQGTSNYEKLFFVPIAVIGDSTNSAEVVIKFSSISDTFGTKINIPDVTLTFQRGKILNEANTETLSLADAVAGLQYLAKTVDSGTETGQVNVINMASIMPPEASATGIKPSIKAVIALMQKLVGLRDDTFQLVTGF